MESQGAAEEEANVKEKVSGRNGSHVMYTPDRALTPDSLRQSQPSLSTPVNFDLY